MRTKKAILFLFCYLLGITGVWAETNVGITFSEQIKAASKLWTRILDSGQIDDKTYAIQLDGGAYL